MFIAIPRTFEDVRQAVRLACQVHLYNYTTTFTPFNSPIARLASPLTTKIQTFTRTGLSMWLGIRTTHGSRLTSLHSGSRHFMTTALGVNKHKLCNLFSSRVKTLVVSQTVGINSV
ncbi:hypothetical protein B0H14DRAFT_2593894 [Mycena olivaceomarginata]|nr:hypothetical protein B0H14DRAFT_2593894 [Mycena olivaceomarginata]